MLLLSGWFDRLLWRGLENAVSQHGERLANIALIKASYVKKSGGVYLSIGRVVVRGNGKTLHLNRSVKLPL